MGSRCKQVGVGGISAHRTVSKGPCPSQSDPRVTSLRHLEYRLKMQVPGPIPDLQEPNLRGSGPGICILTNPYRHLYFRPTDIWGCWDNLGEVRSYQITDGLKCYIFGLCSVGHREPSPVFEQEGTWVTSPLKAGWKEMRRQAHRELP